MFGLQTFLQSIIRKDFEIRDMKKCAAIPHNMHV